MKAGKKAVYLMMSCILLCCSTLLIHAAYIAKSDFKPKSSKEKVVGHTETATWNNGSFFETVTYQRTGFDDATMKMKYRFRYYISHKGQSGSYIYQKVPVGVFLDGKKVATFTDYLNVHIANKSQLCGEKTVTLKPGTHVVELRDIKDGAMTVVNVKKTLIIPLPTYTVRFLDDDGTFLKSQEVERYQSASAPAVPGKEDRSFIGWDQSFDDIRDDMTITAQYETNTYLVNFLDYDGKVLKQEKVSYGQDAHPPANPSRTGYDFQGWDGSYHKVTSSRNLYARYNILTFQVTFDSQGGTPVPSQTIPYGSKAGYPGAPQKHDATFLGWYNANESKYDFQQAVTASFTLYAHWDLKPKLSAKDITIFEDLYTAEQWKAIRMEKVIAMDEEDGDIKHKVKVIKDTTNLHTMGTYELVYEVVDSAQNRAETSCRVHVLDKRAKEDQSRQYIRSISASYVSTLHKDSIWKCAAGTRSRLENTLQKTSSSQAVSLWHIKREDLERIRAFNKRHGYSQEDNRLFLQEFSHLRTKGGS